MKHPLVLLLIIFLGCTTLAPCQQKECPDQDDGKMPPADISIGLLDKVSTELSNGYLWRVTWKLHKAWQAQRPVPIDDWWYIDIRFTLDSEGGISEIVIPNAKLDDNAKKAIRAFLDTTPWEGWSSAVRAKIAKPVRLSVTFSLEQKKPNSTPSQPADGS